MTLHAIMISLGVVRSRVAIIVVMELCETALKAGWQDPTFHTHDQLIVGVGPLGVRTTPTINSQ